MSKKSITTVQSSVRRPLQQVRLVQSPSVRYWTGNRRRSAQGVMKRRLSSRNSREPRYCTTRCYRFNPVIEPHHFLFITFLSPFSCSSARSVSPSRTHKYRTCSWPRPDRTPPGIRPGRAPSRTLPYPELSRACFFRSLSRVSTAPAGRATPH